MGRPRKNPPDEDTILSFKVSKSLVDALDNEAGRMTSERPRGSSPISRTEAIKVILYRWLDSHGKQRT